MLAMAVLCHRFGLRQGGAALTVQLAWKAFLGFESCTKRKRIALSFGSKSSQP
jgi:hypothetical protein